MSRLLLLTLALLLFNTGFGQALETKILKMERARFNAMIAKDGSYLNAVLSDNLVYIHSNGAHDTKESFITSITAGTLQYFSIDVQNTDIRIHGSTAWIHGAAKMKVKNGKDAQIVELSIRYLDIYKRDGGLWKLVAWQSARMAQ
ncbi:MAG TPA: nuclear transport factor 2 family protein [Chitinophagaceae bacterium]|nr:nuclear transport factor 2 family protein [Chitinophagaceae bacterium]